jgi:molybdopterin-synthase adenylyltransferase
MEPKSFRLPRHFQLIALAEDDYYVVSLTSSLRLRSPEPDGLLTRLLPFLAQGANLDTLLSVGGEGRSGQVLAILDDLKNRSLLEEMPATTTYDADLYDEQERFFANFQPFGADEVPSSAQHKLAKACVLVAGLGRTGSRLALSMAHAGVGTIWGADPGLVTDTDLRDGAYDPAAHGKVREHVLGRIVGSAAPRVNYRPVERAEPQGPCGWQLPDSLDLMILCAEGFDPEYYDSINRLALENNLSWTSLRSLGARYEIGPTVVPRQTACFHCFELRRRSNSSIYQTHRDTWGSLAARGVGLGSLNVTFGADLLALEVVKILTGFSRPATYGSLFTLDLLTLEASVHPVLKIPRCPQCSSAAVQRPALIIWPPGDGFEDFPHDV